MSHSKGGGRAALQWLFTGSITPNQPATLVSQVEDHSPASAHCSPNAELCPLFCGKCCHYSVWSCSNVFYVPLPQVTSVLQMTMQRELMEEYEKEFDL